jgi:TolB-like protein/tRNA A-37 threonylcarbamoyl transferase component Bud32
MGSERVLHDVVGAMIDGAPIDWAAAELEAADDESTQRIVRELKVIAAIADVHGTEAISSAGRSLDVQPGNVSPGEQPQDAAHGDSPVQELGSWGPLRLLEKIGEGAFGSVYRAWDTRLDREVALKLLHRLDAPRARETSGVVEEGRILAQVRHPNVVTVHGADRSDGRVGVWTEFIYGETVEQSLRERGTFGAAEATLIGLNVCRALSAVHRAGLLHRDIKAHNVMREHGGRIVLMDFGTGIPYRDSSDSTAGLAGTPLYMAPEVLDGGEATVRSDVYSVGVLLYHVVTGSYPVVGHTVQEIRGKHSRRERILLRDARPNLPEDFVRAVERALSPEPDRRYESAGAMEAALASVDERARHVRAATTDEALVGPAVASTLPLPSEDRTRWRPRLLALAFLGLVVGVGSLWVAARKFAVKPDTPVIAVLPFKNLSTEADSDYFVDGLTDEVIRNLSVIDGLVVRSSASSFAFKNKNPSTRDISQQLNANLVLEASVFRAGARLRIDAQLVRAADDVPLWSARYDRELQDVFAIQDEISRSIVNELRLKLGRGQRRYTADVEAYDRYLKARVLQARRGPATRQAIDLLDEVIAKDPGFAPAYAARASAYGVYLVLQVPSVLGLPVPPDQARTFVRRDALEAMRLDPLLAEAHDALGWVHSLDFEWADAEKSFRHAIELNPSLTTTFTDFVVGALLPEGKLNEALAVLSDGVRADPLSPDVRRTLSIVQISARQYDAALDNCRRAIELDRRVFAANTRCEQALIHKGRVAEAIALMEKFVTDTPALKGGRGYGYLGYAYAISGRRAEAETQALRNEGLPHQQAMIYGGLGDKERAFAAIAQLAALNPHRALSWLTRPELDLLRGDPRVAALQRTFGLLR